jgi:hypothetical protein
MNVQGWLLTGATILTMVAVIVYTVVTYMLHRDAKRELGLLEKDISLSRTPCLALGAHGDEKEYIECLRNVEDFSQSQIDIHIERMKASGAKEYFTYRNVSANPAFQVKLICFNKLEGLYARSPYTQNYITPGAVRMDYLILASSEDIVKEELIENYGRDVITELKDNDLLTADRGHLYYILLYTDYNKNLYALRRIGEVGRLGIPEYYDLGPPK